MTTIAWDGRTLAADRGAWSNGLHQPTKKVFRITAPDRRRFLVAFAGDTAFCMQVLRWMEGKGGHPGACLSEDEAKDCAVVIDEKLRIWRLSSRLFWYRFRGSVHSFGAGQEVALGALMAGADAIKAVRITMAVSDYAARGVDWVRFK